MFRKYGASMFRDGQRFAKSTAAVADVDDEPHFCVEGLSIETEKLLVNKLGETIWFEPTAFDDDIASGNKPELWHSHDKTKVVGSNVELCAVNVGVAFRFQLPNTTLGQAVKDMVLSGEQNSVSIGFTEVKTRDEVHFGHKVRHIEQASIREVSICPRGASSKAFARIIDANKEPPLRESVGTTMFGIEYDLHAVKILSEDNHTDMLLLARRLLALNGEHQYSDEPITFSIMASQSNRIQTETIEQMQRQRRAKLRSM
jgi:HK97 family phage prohead protease